MKKRILAIAISLVAGIAVALGAIGILYFATPIVYGNTWEKGFTIQYKAIRKSDANQSRVILYGGSNIAYSIDNELIREQTGIPTYTLGNDRGLGINYPMDLLEREIRKGDIVIFPFDAFVSEDYGMELLYAVWDGEPDMLWSFASAHPALVAKTIGKGAYTKAFFPAHEALKTGLQSAMGWADDESMKAEHFNRETGQYTYPREDTKFSPTSYQGDPSKTMSVGDVDVYCINRLSAFSKTCQAKGASFYLFYPSTYEKHIDGTVEGLNAFGHTLSEKTQVPLLDEFGKALLPYEQMYDGPTHPNTLGSKAYSAAIAEAINSRK